MAEDIFKDVPEDVLQYIKVRYEKYKVTAEEPVISFEDYILKVYDLAITVVGLKNQKETIEEEIVEVEKEIAEVEAEDLLNDFNKVYEIIVNDIDLTQKEKLDNLKAYYLTVVRDMAKEVKFLNNLNSLIKEQDSEGYTDVLLIDFNEYVKQFYD